MTSDKQMREPTDLITRRRSADTYHEAMMSCPTARRVEFEYPVTLAQPRNGEVLVDFPSAGGYLGPYLHKLAPEAVYCAVEHAPEYRQAGLDVSAGSWQRLHFADRSVDIVLSLAALHHVFPGRQLFYRECRRILRPGGRLIIADVAEGSGSARFLAEFVDEHSPEGHVARFFRADLDRQEIESCGFRVSHWEVKDFCWYFPDRGTAIRFCRGLFRLGAAADEEIWGGLNHYLGFEVTDAGIAMGWQLAFIRADLRSGVSPD